MIIIKNRNKDYKKAIYNLEKYISSNCPEYEHDLVDLKA